MRGPDTAISIARPLSLSDHNASAPLDRRNLKHACWRKSSGRSGRPPSARSAGLPTMMKRNGGVKSHRDHVGGDEPAQPDAGVKPFGREVDQLLARGHLHLDLGVGLAEGCDKRLQQDRYDGTRHREAQPSGVALSEVTRDPACGDKLLEGGFCARQESFAGFGQADSARRADEERRPDARLKCAHRLRKLRCWATLRPASMPSSAPRRTVKFCFIACRRYRG
jgi:hypothetical protein